MGKPEIVFGGGEISCGGSQDKQSGVFLLATKVEVENGKLVKLTLFPDRDAHFLVDASSVRLITRSIVDRGAHPNWPEPD